jgi:hypothetical protein
MISDKALDAVGGTAFPKFNGGFISFASLRSLKAFLIEPDTFALKQSHSA